METNMGSVLGAFAIAKVICLVSEAIDPISTFISLTRPNLMAQACPISAKE